MAEVADTGIEVILKKEAFGKMITTYTFKNNVYKDLNPFFDAASIEFKKKTKEVLLEMKKIKSYATLEAVFIRPFKSTISGTGNKDNENSE